VLSDDKEHEFWVDRQIGTSRHDQQLFVTAAGGSLRREHDIADILALLKEAVPHLCSLETGDGKIVVLERELRKKLWELKSAKCLIQRSDIIATANNYPFRDSNTMFLKYLFPFKFVYVHTLKNSNEILYHAW
jgi:hypothetical protein